MRRVVMSLVIMASACGPIQSAKVADQINGMVGLSKARVLSCLGPPTSEAQADSTEVWVYAIYGAVHASTFASGGNTFAVANTNVSQDSCVVNLTFRDGIVVTGNYRSHGPILAPSLTCYTALSACVPNPTSSSERRTSLVEALTYCKSLYSDARLAPIRGVVAIAESPSLEMQSDPRHLDATQRPAVSALGPLRQQCRSKIDLLAPQLSAILSEINPDPQKDITDLYQDRITIGQYNTIIKQRLDKLKAFLTGPQ
ncbi:hypothetical protein Asru_0169_03 [Acidisphaera rubrifaciens HS-AP3]|uniref:Lipoprotein n=1 Tax=Acidisphaera rubrifaciens HS-AP3 TaxID=1231350 RepID=A0A0D6P7K3_9PROT|nr:hypothetical protein Asru_0169_03 [Acidisphaera rubrifaciens HS-AP3]